MTAERCIKTVSRKREADDEGNGEGGGVPGSEFGCNGVEDHEVEEEDRGANRKQAIAFEREDQEESRQSGERSLYQARLRYQRAE